MKPKSRAVVVHVCVYMFSTNCIENQLDFNKQIVN